MSLRVWSRWTRTDSPTRTWSCTCYLEPVRSVRPTSCRNVVFSDLITTRGLSGRCRRAFIQFGLNYKLHDGAMNPSPNARSLRCSHSDLWLVFSLDRMLHSRWNGTTFFVITSGTCVVFLLLSPTSFAPRHWKTLWTPCGTRRWSTTASPTTKCREKLSGKEQTSPPSVKFF